MMIADLNVRRLIADLEDWARWSRGYTLKLGYPSRAAVLSSGYVSMAFDEMCERADHERCKIIDALVDDLEPSQKAAINRRYLHAVWRFPRNNYPEMLAAAHDELLRKMPMRGL